MADLVNFSSFSTEEEKSFVPFERTMRENAKKAATMGLVVGGVLLVLMTVVNLGMYSPCTAYCERPPSVCKSEANVAAFKANCETACHQLTRESGLSIVREKKTETEVDGKKVVKSDTTTEEVTGEAYVTQLAGCAFAGGGGSTCEAIVKNATQRGLWCVEKD